MNYVPPSRGSRKTFRPTVSATELPLTFNGDVAVTVKGKTTGHLFAPCHTTEVSRNGRCKRFLLGGRLAHTCSLDAKLDRLAQARSNEVGFRALP